MNKNILIWTLFLLITVGSALAVTVDSWDVNNSFIDSNETGYKWVSTNSNYEAHFKEISSEINLAKIKNLREDETIIIQAEKMNYYNNVTTETISNPRSVNGTVNGSKITYENAYTTLNNVMDMGWISYSDVLKEYLYLKNLNFSEPTLNDTQWLEFQNLIKFNESIFDIYVNDILENESFLSDGKIEFRRKLDNETIWKFPILEIEDSNGTESKGYYRVVRRNNEIDMYIQVNWTWLNDSSRTFPIIIDPTVTIITQTGEVSMELGSDGYPRILYLKSADDPYYIEWNGTGWDTPINVPNGYGNKMELALDSNDNPHIVTGYGGTHEQLRYIWYNGTDWNYKQLAYDVGGQPAPSIVVDDNDDVHISWCDSTADVLVKYTYYNGTTWVNETVVDITYCMDTDIAMDSSGMLYVASINTAGDRIYVYKRVGVGSWTSSMTDGSGDKRLPIKVAIDSNDNPQVVHRISDNLYFGYYNGTDWDKVIFVDSIGSTWYSMDFCIGDDDWAYMSYPKIYPDPTYKGYLRYAKPTAITTWTLITLDDGGDVQGNYAGGTSSIAMGPYNPAKRCISGDCNPHIAYIYSDGTKELRYLYWNGSVWGGPENIPAPPANVAPNITTPTITPDPAYTSDDLTCNTTTTDQDGDNTTVYFKWYKNNVNIVNDSVADQVNGSVVTDILENGNFSLGDNIICSVRAYDGTDYSSWKNSTTLTISNQAPTITLVTPGGPYDPTENNVTPINISFIADDADGVADLNDTSAQIVVSKDATSHTSTSCSVSDLNSTAANYTCEITMDYYDVAGTWAVNASVQDISAELVYNDTETFTYNTLKAIQLFNKPVEFGSISIGAGATSNNISTKNTGNVQYNITFTGANLTYSSNIIPADDMKWDIDSNPSDGTAVSEVSQTIFVDTNGSDINYLWHYILVDEVGLPVGSYSGTFTYNAI